MEQAYGTTWPNAQASIWQPTAQASNAQASTCQTPAKPQLMGPICSTPPAHSPERTVTRWLEAKQLAPMQLEEESQEPKQTPTLTSSLDHHP